MNILLLMGSTASLRKFKDRMNARSYVADDNPEQGPAEPQVLAD
jgi:hypothetical protein